MTKTLTQAQTQTQTDRLRWRWRRRLRYLMMGALCLGLASLLPPSTAAGADDTVFVSAGQPGGDPAPETAKAVELNRRGRYEDAILASRAALLKDEHHVPALIALAKSYYYLKKYELASAILDLAKQLDAGNCEIYDILGMIAVARDDIASATASFKKATELNHDYGNAWNNLAAQYILAKNYDAALAAADRATQLLPGFDKAFLNLGSAYRGKGMNAEAERAYQRALALNSTYANAYFNLGILYLDAPQMGEMDTTTRLNNAINYLVRYKNQASFRMAKDDPVDAYIEEARKDIEREQKRLERERKKRERDAARPAPPAEQPSTERLSDPGEL